MRLTFLFLFLSGLLGAQTWLQLSDFPATERDDGVAVVVNNTAYFGTGLTTGWALSNDFYALDVSSNTWSAIASMPVGTERQYACAFKGPTGFYVFGGGGAAGLLNDLYKYDISTNSWSSMASKPGAVLYGASCLEFGDKIIIVGGRTLNNAGNNEVWEYSISTNSWLQKNQFPTAYGARWRASAGVYNNTGYLIFGLDANSSYRKELLSYNPVNDTWTKIADFPSGEGRTYAAMNVVNDKLVLFAGMDSLGNFYKDVWEYTILTNIWSTGQLLPDVGRRGGMSCAAGNKLYYTCGIDSANQRLKETWLLDFPVGLNEFSASYKNGVVVYPNPFETQLFFECKSTALKEELIFEIFDCVGRKVKKLTAREKSGQLFIGELEAGVYQLKISDKSGFVENKSLVKSN